MSERKKKEDWEREITTLKTDLQSKEKELERE